MNRGWLCVIIGAVFEVCWVVGFKHAQSPLAWTGTIAAVVLSFLFLVRAADRLPTGTVYAVFTGLGTLGTVVLEMAVFGEPFRLVKVFLIVLLAAGVIGLKTVTDGQREAPDEKEAPGKPAVSPMAGEEPEEPVVMTASESGHEKPETTAKRQQQPEPDRAVIAIGREGGDS